jgi:DNA repair exonuclease SbcCD nuclease subunit
MKIALVADTHWGVRNDGRVFIEAKKRFLDEVFFPYLDKHDIKVLFHLGDLTDRRKYCNYVTLNRLKVDFLDQIKERDLEFYIIAGNHDCFYKETNKLNSLQELLSLSYPKFKIFTETTEIKIDGLPIFLIPWMNVENRDKTMAAIKKSKAQICFGHLNLKDFATSKGNKTIDGDDPRLFQRFDMVISGHFHHRSTGGNIYYLGNPVEFDWSDYDDPKGFHIFDTDTRELEFIQNPSVIFKKVFYDDTSATLEELMNENFESYKGCYVKLVVQNKNNPYWFDLFVDALEKAEITDLQIVEDHHNLDNIDDTDLISEVEDTITIFYKTIDQMEENVNKDALKKIMAELYQEALEIQ